MIFVLAAIYLEVLLTGNALTAVNICNMESRCSFKTAWVNPKID